MSGSDYFELMQKLAEIKDLLLVVLIASSVMAVTFCFLSYTFIKASRKMHINLEARAFQVEAAALLDRGAYEKLKELASGREISSPGDPLAQYYLGMSYFRCNEYVESKKCFTKLMQLDARYKRVAESHLAQIEEALRQLKPKLV